MIMTIVINKQFIILMLNLCLVVYLKYYHQNLDDGENLSVIVKKRMKRKKFDIMSTRYRTIVFVYKEILCTKLKQKNC